MSGVVGRVGLNTLIIMQVKHYCVWYKLTYISLYNFFFSLKIGETMNFQFN